MTADWWHYGPENKSKNTRISVLLLKDRTASVSRRGTERETGTGGWAERETGTGGWAERETGTGGWAERETGTGGWAEK